MDKTEKIIGKNLKRIRTEEYNMTQKEFSDLIGMTTQNLSQSERGVYKPGLDKLMEISTILNITPNDLLIANESRKYFEEKNRHLSDPINSITSLMEVWEPYRAKAEIARFNGDKEKELEILQRLVNQLAFTNEHWRKIADFVYYSKLDSYVKQASDNYLELYSKPKFKDFFPEIFKNIL